ncbi:cell division cycle protein [Calycina marina]|uniref:Cell division cycle protein n=1 Tax=Calycina marina TaxID=1763456 RepID=A0A9P8CJB3_9HELO|nr:cell division cycle protein [Calycina marina]
MSQPNANANWPPKSPHQALLLTPGGRERLKRFADCGSPSPSPSKRLKPNTPGRRGADMDLGDSGEDDEETLELKLREIQARLKLKKLQKKAKPTSDAENDQRTDAAPLARSSPAAAGRAQYRIIELRDEHLQRSKSQASSHVEIPVSPVRRVRPIEHTSPKRVLLGIDKGVKASDISLKPAPTRRKQQSDLTGPFLQREDSQAGTRSNDNSNAFVQTTRTDSTCPPSSFNARLLLSRAQEIERLEREERIKKNRSKGFGIDQRTIRNFKDTAVELLPAPRMKPEFSRDEILNSFNNPGSKMPRSRTTPNLGFAHSGNTADAAYDIPVFTGHAGERLLRTAPKEVSETETSSFEPFSSTHLSKRIIPHKELTRIISGKKTFLIPDLLREVKSPDFSAPDCEEDIVLFATIASKSDPKSHSPASSSSKNNNRGKFMIMQLTDLKWELDLFLFDTAFEQFWKVTPGTIIAILNPGFMPPSRGKEATGKFSLTLNSSSDTILEIGSSRDLGFCKSVKKDGKACDSWVDKRHTEYCSFHVNIAVERNRGSRMELSSMTFGRGRGRDGASGGEQRRLNSRDMTGMLEARQKKILKERTRYDRESHSQIFISKRSTSNMLDDVDYDADSFHRGTKQERITKQILEKEREREMARKLGGGMGSGLGADYLRKKTLQPDPSKQQGEVQAKPLQDAAKLGLRNGKAKDMQLGPINKRKRANTVSSAAAVGWGGELTKKLGKMRDGETLQPIKKKTRFVTEKGIREAGRESLGGDAAKNAFNDVDDDDDDLDIVRE